VDEDGCRWEHPLMTWAAHKGWCSQVQFIPSNSQSPAPPLVLTAGGMDGVVALWDVGKGLHSSTFRLNLSAFCGIGGTFRGFLGGV
jgi:WD40 repeat protein